MTLLQAVGPTVLGKPAELMPGLCGQLPALLHSPSPSVERSASFSFPRVECTSGQPGGILLLFVFLQSPASSLRFTDDDVDNSAIMYLNTGYLCSQPTYEASSFKTSDTERPNLDAVHICRPTQQYLPFAEVTSRNEPMPTLKNHFPMQ